MMNDDSLNDLGLGVADYGVEENEMMGDEITVKLRKSWPMETGKLGPKYR